MDRTAYFNFLYLHTEKVCVSNTLLSYEVIEMKLATHDHYTVKAQVLENPFIETIVYHYRGSLCFKMYSSSQRNDALWYTLLHMTTWCRDILITFQSYC